ncbi:MAG: glycosyltransferase family 2 protein [Saprospiraceae bacterium]|nr:glycosyltransferase family 2 protein [Saprospiraceae bacterium]
MDLSIVIPLLNERESLPELHAWIRNVLDDLPWSWEILFVDDGSQDGSWEVITALAAKDPAVKGVRFSRNYGKSAALQTAFSRVKGNVVITMDADLQDNPEEIPALVHMIREEGFDLVSGWKKVRHDPALTKNLPSKFYNWTVRRMTGIPLHDFNCGLKAYKREVVRAIEIYGDMHRYIPVLAKWAGFHRIGEKVVRHQERKFGVSKFGVERFVRGPLDLLSVMFISRFGKRPMHFFGPLGVLFFLIGLVILLVLSWQKLMHHEYGIADRPLFYFGILALIMGTQLFVTGFLAELISRSASQRNDYLIRETTGI